ncbi:thiolase C-terminal domain-containing protein [Halalkalicoccus jeotgali]|uniref:Thiolase n=1 Tax=Halalkalicoccus jeotgali (strain DSM 18796 / CECT 7217 / JCM 14584 / KCTC 4019 / B3) TaxID=795797 RepID=D8JB22_HALJB|nr:beta-ketoacyl synthase N-terminal-like domain-containing protein [Halalkalicoccus jeotgali]ADJ16475.1 Thiolase [Halalkalicoccus jeotgali B3]ELY41429.1 Thiolase [Halalkalicoccus jeotgali B3]
MRDAYVIGAGQSSFGSFPEETYLSLFESAFETALDSVSGDLSTEAIDEAYLGTLGVGGRQIGLSGPAVTEHIGLHGVPTTRVENACAASGYAFRQAVTAVRSGMVDVALAGGYEVMTDTSADQTKWWLGVSGETEWERISGTTFAGVYAQMASAHLEKYDTTVEDLSRVAVKNHANGAKNPKAHLGFECSLEDAVSAPSVADPLNLYHCCPTTDGASAVLVASEEVAREHGDELIRVAGAGAASGRVGLFQRGTLTSIPASVQAGEAAYEEAGIGPEDLDFAEVHDCFAIAELLAYEDLGFCEHGEAGRLLREGVTDPDGELPTNTSGGLKSKGHPIGATGTGQIVEAFEQFRDKAHVQIEEPRYGLAHNVGGSGGGVTVHVFEREEAA